MLRQVLHGCLRKRADHDTVEIARKRIRRIRDGLSAADLEIIGRQEQGPASELIHADLEGDARPRGRFLEDHAETLAFERLVLFSAFLHLF